jgi:hypothetical protein
LLHSCLIPTCEGVACGDKVPILLSHSVLLKVTYYVKLTNYVSEIQIFLKYEWNYVSGNWLVNSFLSILMHVIIIYASQISNFLMILTSWYLQHIEVCLMLLQKLKSASQIYKFQFQNFMSYFKYGSYISYFDLRLIIVFVFWCLILCMIARQI